MSIYAGLEGTKFYRLTLLEGYSKKGLYHYKCLCDCGKITEVRADALNETGSRGATKSCGCYRTDLIVKRSTKHGCSKRSGVSDEYIVWNGIKDRCNNENNKRYCDYGGRGITVCERWNDFSNFYEDMGDKPNEKASIDRIDNTKGYFKENCKWSNRTEQAFNQRKYKNNTSGNVGVYFDKVAKKWRAQIRFENKGHTIGRYATIEEAIKARQDAEIKYFGRIIKR
jgi:hypothetical protein